MQRLKIVVRAVRDAFVASSGRIGALATGMKTRAADIAARAAGAKGALIAVGVVAAGSYLLYVHPPVENVKRGELGIRVNQLTGDVTEFRDGAVFVFPLVHELKMYSLRDQTYRAEQLSRADGPAPAQSVEGLSFGVDLAIRYAVDPTKVSAISKNLPDDIDTAIVEPAMNGIVYKTFARYTVREIFSTKRAEIQQAIEAELGPRLAADGIALKAVQMGKVDLPADYKRGMEGLLAEELASEKMRYTLELKDKRVKETQLEGEAEKARREKAAEAAAREQIIAAKAQEEAMKHILPLRERQVQQRQLEAEAQRVARVKQAEGDAQARRIEATGEADARQKLADAEAYKLDRVGKANAEQMQREGVLITKHPLLIQKTLADKLSDKIQVIVAPPPQNGGFIGANLIGGPKSDTAVAEETPAEDRVASRNSKEK